MIRFALRPIQPIRYRRLDDFFEAVQARHPIRSDDRCAAVWVTMPLSGFSRSDLQYGSGRKKRTGEADQLFGIHWKIFGHSGTHEKIDAEIGFCGLHCVTSRSRK